MSTSKKTNKDGASTQPILDAHSEGVFISLIDQIEEYFPELVSTRDWEVQFDEVEKLMPNMSAQDAKDIIAISVYLRRLVSGGETQRINIFHNRAILKYKDKDLSGLKAAYRQIDALLKKSLPETGFFNFWTGPPVQKSVQATLEIVFYGQIIHGEGTKDKNINMYRELVGLKMLTGGIFFAQYYQLCGELRRLFIIYCKEFKKISPTRDLFTKSITKFDKRP